MISRQIFEPGRLGAIQSTTDVTSWDTLSAPDDDIPAAIIAEQEAAIAMWGAANIEQHSSQYGFTLQAIADLFKQISFNPASRYLFDATQGAGTAEKPIIADFFAHVPRAQRAIGRTKFGQILHEKGITNLYPDGTGWTVTGSFNLSASASKQFNVVDIVRSRSRAELFRSRIDEMFDYVSQNQKQPA
jgi:hypothetical protein